MKSPDQVLDPPEAPLVAPVERPGAAAWRLGLLIAAIVGLGFWQGWSLVIVIMSILVMIFLHELGHFVMARRAGMKVTEFFIGFGPRIWSFRRGEVEYGIKAIPAGAYVRIIGMSDVDEVPVEDEGRTYRRGSYLQRLGVAVAGSTMHFLIALVLLVIVFAGFGVTSKTNWTSDAPTEGSAAALGGIRKGDKVVAIDGVPVATHAAMGREARKHPNQVVSVEIIRDGRRQSMELEFGARSLVIGTRDEDMSLGSLAGVITVNSIESGSIQAKAGLADGDRIISINGTGLTALSELGAITDAASTGRLDIVAERDGARRDTVVDLGAKVSALEPTGFLGIGPEYARQRLNPIAAVGRAVTTLGSQGAQTVFGVGKAFNPVNIYHFANRVFTGEQRSTTPTSARDVADQQVKDNSTRPLSIIGVISIGDQLTADIATFLTFLAGVNLVIGIINLIPLPPFDGGHVMIATYEKIRELLRRDGRRYLADTNKILPVAYGVLILMLTVGLLAGFADITQPLKI